MKKVILCMLLMLAAVLTGCYPFYEEAEETTGEIVVIPPQSVLGITEYDTETAESLQSAWEDAQEHTITVTVGTEGTTESEIETTTETTTEETTVTSETTSATTQKKITIPKKSAEEILSEMSLSEKIGQLIMARYPSDAAEQMSQYKFGGYTLYAQDFNGETPVTVTAELFRVSLENKIMPFFAVDEEGGEITRVSRYSAFAETRLPSVQNALKNGMTMDEWTEQMAVLLKNTGINLNFAPVADVTTDKSDYIYNRTAGLDHRKTGEVISEIVTGMNKQGLMGCLKHFPGYGPNSDTHTGIAVDTRPLSDFTGGDFIPFKKGIKAGVPMVMVSHNIVEAFNKDVPASLSTEVHDELRGLGFEGIIITDDLGMDAITLYTDTPYVTAFLAGNDMLCTSDGARTYRVLLDAALDGTIPEERIDESVLRIINAKLEYKIIQ